MKGTRTLARYAFFLLAGLVLLPAGCTDTGSEAGAPGQQVATEPTRQEQTTTLAFSLVEQTAGEVVLDIAYLRPDDGQGPRMMELYVGIPEGLSLAGSEALESTIGADKDLVVQEADGLELRLIIMSTKNLNTLDSGPLARLRLQRAAGATGKIEFIDRHPIFAPAEADRGVTLGEPLNAGGQ